MTSYEASLFVYDISYEFRSTLMKRLCEQLYFEFHFCLLDQSISCELELNSFPVNSIWSKYDILMAHE